MTAMPEHRLVMEDRGPEHIHRWTATCAGCNWRAVHRKRRRDATALYEQHLPSRRSVAVPQGRSGWRPPTPRDQLPEELR